MRPPAWLPSPQRSPGSEGPSLAQRLGLAPPGRVLAVKWGYNPNSSSLGVDVTFLLFGMAAVSFLTPVVGLLLRTRRAAAEAPSKGPEPS